MAVWLSVSLRPGASPRQLLQLNRVFKLAVLLGNHSDNL